MFIKTHNDLLAHLNANKMCITPTRRVLLQYILDHQEQQINLRKLQQFLNKKIPGIDPSSIYRNIENLKNLGIRVCGRLCKVNRNLFSKVEIALKGIHEFSKVDMSILLYGQCAKCNPTKSRKKLKLKTQSRAI